MKAEHRKELQTNALADGLGRLLQGMKTGPSRGSLVLWGAAAVIVLAVVGWYYFAGVQRDQTSTLWRKVDANDRDLSAAEDLTKVESLLKDIDQTARENEGTPAARALRFQQARALMQLGLERLYNDADRKAAVEQLRQAVEVYKALAQRATGVPSLQQEALLMIAKASESLGEVDEALVKYREAARLDKGSAHGKEADERAKYLEVDENRRRVESFYKEMAKIAEARAKPPEPTPSLPPLPVTPAPEKK